MPELTGTNRDKLLSIVQNSDLSNNKYRAYGRKLADGGIEWVEINGHDYDKVIRILEKMN